MKYPTIGHRLSSAIRSLILAPTAALRIGRLLEEHDIRVALDMGCGTDSVLRTYRPRLRTIGVDADAITLERARAAGTHDEYVLANVLDDDLSVKLARMGHRSVDLIVIIDVVEHLPKRAGFELLEKCELMTGKFIVVQTPNGFLEQGPEFGNPYQRHLSGWFPQDFRGLGYRVYGTTGTRLMRGYAARIKWPVPGGAVLDALLAKLLRTSDAPSFAFNLLAIKDVRGVPPRLSTMESEGPSLSPSRQPTANG